jgi:single-stranded DNA-specific DHH superfamily exonuclease
MLNEKQYLQILEELDHCKRPLFFFHDDADGLCSFLLLYRYKSEGKGVCVKSQPKVDSRFFKVVNEFMPDKIFILDLAIVEDEFLDEFKIPIVWIDHHTPAETRGTKYFNPRVENPTDNICASELCYNVIKNHRPEDLWIAAVGIVGDWQLSAVTQEFAKQYPDLLPESVSRPQDALFDTPFSKLIKVYNLLLKGKTQEVMKCVKIFTRIESPYELLEDQTSRAKFIMKRFSDIDSLYEELLAYSLKQVSDSKLLVVTYKENQMSFSGELANEMLYRYPNKIIIVGREKGGEMKCSVRSGPGTQLAKALERALVGVKGYGGGHEHACGACITLEDFPKFLEQLTVEVSKE